MSAALARPDSGLMTNHSYDDRPVSPGLVQSTRARTRSATFLTPTPGLPAGSVQYTPFVAPSGAGSIFAPGSKRIATPRILDETYSSSGNPSNGPWDIPALEATNFTVLPRAAVADVTSAQVLGDLVWWGAIGVGIFAAFALASQALASAAQLGSP